MLSRVCLRGAYHKPLVMAMSSTYPTLSDVKDLLLTGKWYLPETKYMYGQDPSVAFEAIQSYSRVGNELTVTQGGVVLRGTRTACKAAYDPKPREPLVMSDLPSRKWSCLCTDFYGLLPSGDYLLVIMDEDSRFPEVEVIRSMLARTVIPVFDKLFSSRGIPDNLEDRQRDSIP